MDGCGCNRLQSGSSWCPWCRVQSLQAMWSGLISFFPLPQKLLPPAMFNAQSLPTAPPSIIPPSLPTAAISLLPSLPPPSPSLAAATRIKVEGRWTVSSCHAFFMVQAPYSVCGRAERTRVYRSRVVLRLIVPTIKDRSSCARKGQKVASSDR